jgi:hypothetical protein
MAERLVPLLATQVARVRSPVPARLTISVEKLALFCNPTFGGTFSSTAIEIINRIKFALAKAKVFPHLEARVRVGSGIPQVKDPIVYNGFVISKNECVKKSLIKKRFTYLP